MKIASANQRYSDLKRQNTDLRMDSKGKEVQTQILDAQKKLKELSFDNVMNEEEKEKKRQQIQQQIAELNQELKKRQLELQRKQQDSASLAASPAEKQAISDPNGLEGSQSPDQKSQTAPYGQTATKAFIAAGSAVGHANSQGKLASELKSKMRILQGEIKQDEARGKDTSFKQKELEKLESKAARLSGSGFSFLADASKELRQAAKKELYPGKKNKTNPSDGFVRPLKSPLSAAPKAKSNAYIKQNLFSNVDFHF